MSTDEVVAVRARRLWQELAAGPVAFGTQGEVNIVVSPGSRMCPNGWLGIVVLGDAAIVTVPDDAHAAAARTGLARSKLTDITDPEALGSMLPVAEFLGPAALAYLSPEQFRPADDGDGAVAVEQLPTGHADLLELREAAGEADWDEAGLDDITSTAFVVRDALGGKPVAAAGYRLWPSRTAHISVLTEPAYRGNGLARATGAAAARHALDAGLLPQWRARVPASRRVAAALGFRELGRQLSGRLMIP
jgi:RimJ/RimL family protein N-acetyltransferase